jgi:hypothetical protein
VGFKPTITASERAKTVHALEALERSATVTGQSKVSRGEYIHTSTNRQHGNPFFQNKESRLKIDEFYTINDVSSLKHHVLFCFGILDGG